MAETNSTDLPLIDEQIARDFLAEMEDSDNVMHFDFNLDAETEFVERNGLNSMVLHWAYRSAVTANVLHGPESIRNILNRAGASRDGLSGRIVMKVHLKCRDVVRKRLGMSHLSEEQSEEFLRATPFPWPNGTQTEAMTCHHQSKLEGIAAVFRRDYPDLAQYIYVVLTSSKDQGYTGMKEVGDAGSIIDVLSSIERIFFGKGENVASSPEMIEYLASEMFGGLGGGE